MANIQYNCIEFNIVTREVFLAAPLGNTANDFVLSDNPSVQNGGILLGAKAFNFQQPIFGTGLTPPINAFGADLVFLLNRWKQQAMTDGATNAKFTADAYGNFTIGIDYIATN